MTTTFTISFRIISSIICAALCVTGIILNARTIKKLQNKQNKIMCVAESVLMAVLLVADAICIVSNNLIISCVALAFLLFCLLAIVSSSWVNHILFSISASKSGHLKIKLGKYSNIAKQIKAKQWNVFFRHTDSETFRFTGCTHSIFMVSDEGKTKITLTGKTPLILINGIIYILWAPIQIHKISKTIFSQAFFDETEKAMTEEEEF